VLLLFNPYRFPQLPYFLPICCENSDQECR
jgi:hypothetical protein